MNNQKPDDRSHPNFNKHNKKAGLLNASFLSASSVPGKKIQVLF